MKPPQVPCEECIKKGKNIKNALIVCYCEHNQALGLYYTGSKHWHLFTPMPKEEFEFYLKKSFKKANELLDKALDKVFELIPGRET